MRAPIAAVIVLLLAGLAALAFALSGGVADAKTKAAGPAPAGLEQAAFAGGCFWCSESDFQKIPGVVEVISGYTGGRVPNPSYEQVSYEETGHYEAVLVRYDPKKVSYADLVERYWRTVDPTDAGGQFCDRGTSYRTAIFVNGEAQRQIAEASKAKLEQSGVIKEKIVTPVLDLAAFYEAEDYHQDYAEKNKVRYNYYRFACGRDARLKQLWGEAAKS